MPASAKLLQSTPDQIQLKIAQVDWCPQICLHEEKPGYIIEILNKVFEDSQFQLIYSSYPWSRGIAHTLNGQTIALLAAAPKETPDLIFPSVPIGQQQACFYALPSSEWRYTSPSSIDDKRIGLPAHISLEELNDYKKEHSKLFHIQASTPRYIELGINMLRSDRLDTFVFFRNTMIHHIRRFYSADTVQQVGCVSPTPVYIVFTPVLDAKPVRDKAIAHYEKRMPLLIEAGYVTKTMERYGLPDWSKYDTD
ncbi:MAG: hypothetical protein AB3N28_07715 [Kordiimonas sp.]